MELGRRELLVAATGIALTLPAPVGATSTDKPFFRFYPGAYDRGGAFERSDDRCPICAKPRVWKYSGNVYAIDEIEGVRARCIADGRLAVHLKGDVQLHDITLTDCDPAAEKELLQRTPGVASFNPFKWPVLNGMPLAYWGEGEQLSDRPPIKEAIDSAWRADGGEGDAPYHYALVFQEISGAALRIVFDFD